MGAASRAQAQQHRWTARRRIIMTKRCRAPPGHHRSRPLRISSVNCRQPQLGAASLLAWGPRNSSPRFHRTAQLASNQCLCGVGARMNAALMLLGLCSLLATASARPLAAAQRRLSTTPALGGKLPVCDVTDPKVHAAFLALDSSCPQAPPYACDPQACWDAMDMVSCCCRPRRASPAPCSPCPTPLDATPPCDCPLNAHAAALPLRIGGGACCRQGRRRQCHRCSDPDVSAGPGGAGLGWTRHGTADTIRVDSGGPTPPLHAVLGCTVPAQPHCCMMM